MAKKSVEIEIATRPGRRIVLTRSFYQGRDLIQVRNQVLGSDGFYHFTKQGVSLNPEEAEDLYSALATALDLPDEHEGVLDLSVPKSGSSVEPQDADGLMLDRALLFFDDEEGMGVGKDEALTMDTVEGVRRIIKAREGLREAGLLHAHSHDLTSKGRKRVEAMRRKTKGTGEIGQQRSPVLLPFEGEGPAE